MNEINVTPELLAAIENLANQQPILDVATLVVNQLNQEKGKFLQTDPASVAADQNLLRLAKLDIRDEAEWKAAIELDVKTTSDWEVAHVYWEAIDLWRAAEEDFFKAGIEVMKLAGYDQKMKLNSLNMEFFYEARLGHMFTIYPKLIETMRGLITPMLSAALRLKMAKHR